MKLLRATLCCTLLAACTLASAAPAALGMMSKNTEVAFSLNAKLVAASPLVKQIIERKAGPQFEAQLSLIENLTGTHPMRDLERVSFFGRVNDDPSIGMAVEGKLDRAKLLTLVKLNESYATLTSNGQEVHQWMDKNEQRMKYGAFLSDTMLVIWNSKEAMELSTATLAAPETSLARSPEAALFTPEAEAAAAWGALFTRNATNPGAKVDLAHAFGTVTLAPDSALARVALTPQSAAAAPQWVDMAKGIVAFGQVQKEKPLLADMARGAKVSALPDGTGVSLEATLSNATILGIVDRGGIN